MTGALIIESTRAVGTRPSRLGTSGVALAVSLLSSLSFAQESAVTVQRAGGCTGDCTMNSLTTNADIQIKGGDIRNSTNDIGITLATGATPKVTLIGDLQLNGGDLVDSSATTVMSVNSTTHEVSFPASYFTIIPFPKVQSIYDDWGDIRFSGGNPLVTTGQCGDSANGVGDGCFQVKCNGASCVANSTILSVASTGDGTPPFWVDQEGDVLTANLMSSGNTDIAGAITAGTGDAFSVSASGEINGAAISLNSGDSVTGLYVGSATVDFDDTAGGTCTEKTTALAGIAASDSLSCGRKDTTVSGGINLMCYPTADTINWRACNVTGSAINPGSAILSYIGAR